MHHFLIFVNSKCTTGDVREYGVDGMGSMNGAWRVEARVKASECKSGWAGCADGAKSVVRVQVTEISWIQGCSTCY